MVIKTKEGAVALDTVMKTVGSEGCCSKGRIILSLHRSCSRQSCFWEGHGRLQRLDALLASFSHTLQI